MWYDSFIWRRNIMMQQHAGTVAAHQAIQNERLQRFQNRERPIRTFSYEGMDAKWGVDLLPEPLGKKKYLITGTGRCGTTYLSRLLGLVGVDVPHGKVGQDGTTSHYFMVDNDWYPVITYNPDDVAHIGERASDYMFEKVIYLVREPLSAIRSLAIFFGNIDEMFYEDAGVVPRGEFARHSDIIWRGMVLYFYINAFIMNTYPENLFVHMEDLRLLRQWDALLEYMGLDYVTMPNLPAQNQMGELTFSSTEIAARKYYQEERFMQGYKAFPRDVTYSYMESLDKKMANQIFDMAAYLGYSIERS